MTGPRIGITKAVERPWRFCLAGNPHVSRPALRLGAAAPPVPPRPRSIRGGFRFGAARVRVASFGGRFFFRSRFRFGVGALGVVRFFGGAFFGGAGVVPSLFASFFAFASAARSALMSCQAEITPAQISAGKVPPITGPPL